MMNPDISVLVTTFNHARWIEQSIESILNQIDVNIEILIHDDNSTDGTWHILDKYKSRCTLIKNDSGLNLGVSKSLNKLIDRCTGKYVALMSGDDLWEKNKLFRQLKYMEENKDIDICFTGVTAIDENNLEIAPNFTILKENSTRSETIIRLFLGNCLPAITPLLRKNKFVINTRFNECLRELQDWDYWIRGICFGLKYHLINEPLAQYRVLKTSISNSGSPQQASRLNLETSYCLKSFLNLSLGEFRSIFGKHVANSNLFIKDRTINTGFSLLMASVNNSNYKRAAAEIMRDHYLSGKSAISDHEYHNFIGSLKL